MNIKRLLIEFFIKKFEPIPDEEIGVGVLFDHCILWHCGLREYRNPNAEALALLELFQGEPVELDSEGHIHWNAVFMVNDGRGEGHTPKERVLNKLNALNEEAH
jgi:hypothetical protein